MALAYIIICVLAIIMLFEEILMHQKKSDYIWINGAIVEWDDANIHITTHALHYSSSVFEGIRAYQGKIFEAELHAQRLIDSAQMLEMDLQYSALDITKILYDVVSKNNIQDAYIRPLVWRGDEELKIHSSTLSTNFAVMCWKMSTILTPINLIVSKWKKFHPDTFPQNCKAGAVYSMMSKVQAEAKYQGYRDALLLDLDGYIAECTCSNIFFCQDDIVYTPKITNILNGITRQTIIKIAKVHNVQLIEKDITIDDLDEFNGCFITGTAVEIVPVSMIDRNDKKIYFSNPSRTNMFIKEYSHLAGKT